MASFTHPRLATKLNTRLVHRCTITPIIDGSKNSFGSPTKVPGVAVTLVHCLYAEVEDVVTGPAGNSVLTRSILYLPSDFSVNTDDIASVISATDGTLITSGKFRIDTISNKDLSHPFIKRCTLTAVK